MFEPADPLMLASANRVRVSLVALRGRSGPRIKVAPRREPAAKAIMAVLRMSDQPLAVADTLPRVELMLGRRVKRASVKATLAEMAQSEAHAVRRVSRGRYELQPSSDA